VKLLIISNMAHYLDGGSIVGWGPGVREIDQLAREFDQVRHVAMLHAGQPPATALAYRSSNVTLVPQKPCGGPGVQAKFGILRRTPEYLCVCLRESRGADVIHVRCPANISLEALLLLRFLPRRKLRWVKYAGNWRPASHEPFFYRLQRRWLELGISRGLVTVNGEWPNQPAHVRSFHNPCFTAGELRTAGLQTRHKQMSVPIRLLFAGRLRPSKGADQALHVLRELRSRGWRARLDMAGDGPQAHPLRELALRSGLANDVTFHGWVAPATLKELYRDAHFLLLPSSTEGWPKVLSEAQAFRCVPLATAVSCIPQILSEAQAGVALEPGDVRGFVEQIERLALDPAAWRRMADNGRRAAADFTYEAYVERVCRLLGIDRARKNRTNTDAAVVPLSATRDRARHAAALQR
jgi:glycosyltransferase involved in cell wall biosynthesis